VWNLKYKHMLIVYITKCELAQWLCFGIVGGRSWVETLMRAN